MAFVVPEILREVVQIPVKPRDFIAGARRLVMAAIDPASDVIDFIPNAKQRVALTPAGMVMIRLIPNTVIMFAKMVNAIVIVLPIVVMIIALAIILRGSDGRERCKPEGKREDEDGILHRGVEIDSHSLRRARGWSIHIPR